MHLTYDDLAYYDVESQAEFHERDPLQFVLGA